MCVGGGGCNCMMEKIVCIFSPRGFNQGAQYLNKYFDSLIFLVIHNFHIPSVANYDGSFSDLI